MTFTVTYRDKTGAKREEALEAASRAECVAACRKRGISPIAIREGGRAVAPRPPQSRTDGARTNADSDGTGRRPYQAGARDARPCRARRRVLVALGTLAFLAILGGAAWWWLGRIENGKWKIENEGEPATVPAMPKAVKDVTPAKQMRQPKPASTNALAPKVAATNALAPKAVTNREMWLGHEIVSKTIVTNGTDLIITRIDTEGKVHKEYTTIHKRLFSNPVDITLSILLTTPEGALTPPLPPLGPRAGDAFIKALKKPIEVPEDATPEERRVVDLVLAAREEMLVELGNGRTVNDVIEDHCTFADENNRLHAEAMVQYKKLVAEGDEDMAEKFRAKANEMLTQKGAKPLKSLAEIQQERISRREEKNR